ncbi:hypothetical protein Desaci_4453 [Desulfosporosinus acidiphilus SJ4]|uniref:Uncharacterized protein n=1 Tax=Desulfosporosinus acidiphilus (strain DSM 22704 / JCM 16185 / SJ4) TaxID=646529 RepID=I4DBX2_DESAJ|nr:hypothetical protein [Desulfosporosinus acidiphilus]AFM43296.1 hypothetical protein Desaci_4453 [Desulfosporosinus acidiphilus SJ4]
MRKMNYLVGGIALSMGVIVGILGMSMVTNSSSAASFISKLRGQENVQTVSGSVNGPTQVPLTAKTGTDNALNNNVSGSSALGTDSNSSPDSTSSSDSSSSSSSGSISGGQPNNSTSAGQNGDAQSIAKGNSVTDALKEQIIADYKQDIGTFFDAWKSVDIDTFRLKLAKAYTGEIFEKHARRAEEYLVQGIGLDVTSINFDRVDVESADNNTATLRVDYRYTAKDYNITEGVPVGEEHEQNVHVRVNLMKMNSHWMITGESSLTN